MRAQVSPPLAVEFIISLLRVRHRPVIDAVRTCLISVSALAWSSASLVKQWQWTIGIIPSYASLSSGSAKIPRNASRNSIALSGRFITKCEICLRKAGWGTGTDSDADVNAESRDPPDTGALLSFFAWDLLIFGMNSGKGSPHALWTAALIKSRPSSSNGFTRC